MKVESLDMPENSLSPGEDDAILFRENHGSPTREPQMLQFTIIYLHVGEKWPHEIGGNGCIAKYSHPVEYLG